MGPIYPRDRTLAIVTLVGLGGFPGVASADWTFVPGISGQELATDNVLATPTNRRSDFVTTVSPTFSLTEDAQRLQGTINYSPALYYYAFTPGQNTIGHNLYANGTATIVPDLAFIDFRAFAGLQPTTPGLTTTPFSASPFSASPTSLGPVAGNPSNGLPALQLTQNMSFSASPYLVRRFGDFGAGELRYTFSNTQTNAPTSPLIAPAGFSAQSSSDRTNEVTASFNTGERFGPYEGRLLLDSAESSGTGVLNQASSHVATLDSAYALTSRIAPLLTIGYEKIQFNGFPPTRINDVIWGFGVRLKPWPDTIFTFRYGHANGITAPNMEISYNVTARMSLTANYSEGLSTFTQQIATNLAASILDQDHQAIDSRTLLPFSIVNPALGVQSGLFRTKQFNATIKNDWERDHVAISIFDSNNIITAQSTPGSGVSQQSLGANISWGHELTPNSTSNVGIGYSQFTFGSPSNSSENLLTTTVSIGYSFSATLTGSVGYSLIDRFSPNPQLRLTSNILSANLHKDF